MAKDWLHSEDIHSVGQAVSSVFGNVRPDNECLVNFTDAAYTINGIVKIDNNFVATYNYTEDGIGKVGISAVISADQLSSHPFLNLSAINRID